jgi:hypothetical protein
LEWLNILFSNLFSRHFFCQLYASAGPHAFQASTHDTRDTVKGSDLGQSDVQDDNTLEGRRSARLSPEQLVLLRLVSWYVEEPSDFSNSPLPPSSISIETAQSVSRFGGQCWVYIVRLLQHLAAPVIDILPETIPIRGESHASTNADAEEAYGRLETEGVRLIVRLLCHVTGEGSAPFRSMLLDCGLMNVTLSILDKLVRREKPPQKAPNGKNVKPDYSAATLEDSVAALFGLFRLF